MVKKKEIKKTASKKVSVAKKKASVKKAKRPKISLVIPVYNEEENLPQLISELEASLSIYEYEAIFIDDGSSDNSLEILKSGRKRNRRLKIIQFNGNYGQHAAFSAGLSSAKGEIIVMLDSDLQNDPADIPRFIDEIENNGMAAAFGWRENRENSVLFRQLPSRAFNWMRNRFLQRPLHDYGCALNAFRREFVEELEDKPEYLKHITTYIASKKVPFTEVRIRERSRDAGFSRYNFMRLLQLGLDLMITTASKPVATAALLGASALAGILFLFSVFALLPDLFSGDIGFIDYVAAPFFFFISSLVCAVLALINERVSSLLRTYYKKPLFIIKEYLD